jgi:thiamine monophosphate kinase
MNPMASGADRNRAIRDIARDSVDIADGLLAELEKTK